MKALRPYQREGVEKLLALTAERHAAILADDPGLGKTAQVCEYLNRRTPDVVLIVCPASLRLNWRNEILTWVSNGVKTDAIEIRSYEEITAGKASSKAYDLVVFDEAHYLKNPKAKRTEACLSIPAKDKLFLTGTPVVNRPMDMYPILHACGMKLTRVEFGKRYCAGKLVRVRYRPKRYAWDFTGASNTEELNRLLRRNVMVRRRKEEVLTELPRKIRQVVELDFPSGESPTLTYAVNRYLDGLASAAPNLKELERIAFEELSKFRLETARRKLQCVLAFARDLLEEEDKVVVFAYHREIVDALYEALSPYGPVKLYGGMTDAAKDVAVRAFQERPEYRVFIGQIQAAGTGLTLTASHTVVFAEEDWVPGNITQAEDRCHRLGQTEVVRVFHLVAQYSADAKMVKVLVNKQNVIQEVME